MPRLGAIYLTVFAWGLIGIVASIPFVLFGRLSIPDALFESLSGLTTTGSSALRAAHYAHDPLIIYRSMLEWVGGLAALLTFFLLLGPIGGRGAARRKNEQLCR